MEVSEGVAQGGERGPPASLNGLFQWMCLSTENLLIRLNLFVESFHIIVYLTLWFRVSTSSVPM